MTQRLETLDRGRRYRFPGASSIIGWALFSFREPTSSRPWRSCRIMTEHSRIYAPRVLGSKLIQHNGDDFKVFLRLSETKIVTVVLDTEYDVHYFRLDSARACSRSYSTRSGRSGKPRAAGRA